MEQDARDAAAGASSTAAAGEASASGAAGSDRAVAELYESALDFYGGEDPDLWLAYCSREAKAGRGVGRLYWRATRALADPEPFILKYREINGLQ